MKFKTKYEFSDYEGKPIYYLTPIACSEQRAKDGSKQWEFECVCGKTIIAPPYRVISGHIRSCGCMRYKNIVHKSHAKGNRSKCDPEKYIGVKNNKLTVIGYTDPSEGRIKLKCLCDCGNIKYVLPYQFANGKVQSCGCRRKNMWNGHRDNYWMVKHGFSHDRLYAKFSTMKRRCYNPNSEKYNIYGGRGITICDEWLNDPAAFVQWAIEHGGLDERLTIDRIDNNGPYSPENCRFTTPKQQQRNLRTNRVLEYNGESHCMAEWAEILGINYGTLSNRIHSGWPIEKALTTPVKHPKSERLNAV